MSPVYSDLTNSAAAACRRWPRPCQGAPPLASRTPLASRNRAPRRETPGEATGDFIIYFNTTVGVGTAHSIARFANIDSLDDLQNANFTAGDFLFA